MHGLHGAPTYMQVADARGGPDDEQDDRDDGHHGHGDLSPSSCIAGDIRRRCRWFNRLARVIPLGLIGVGVDVEGLLGLVVHVDILSRGTRAAGNRGNRIEKCRDLPASRISADPRKRKGCPINSPIVPHPP